MINTIDKKTIIKLIVKSSFDSFFAGFVKNNDTKFINLRNILNFKIDNVYLAFDKQELNNYIKLAQSLDTSLGKMLENIVINIAELSKIKISSNTTNRLFDKNLLKNKTFWNYICKSKDGHKTILDTYKRNYIKYLGKTKSVNNCWNIHTTQNKIKFSLYNIGVI
ncbi:hypothetical protein AUK05_00505 [Candidatus Shapirobacteria bacterium CG2_30_35_20]|uniref:Uncharacterized protein n=3 Tax=Candidatus Shapironibacteriota TaxID=1752721 RepID=A0A1J5HQZ5_9BACT|nr:MAG: hypothetical protein AUK05_00505 [Candidatus Shapirobacteria bacterium CG2_30_35_20]